MISLPPPKDFFPINLEEELAAQYRNIFQDLTDKILNRVFSAHPDARTDADPASNLRNLKAGVSEKSQEQFGKVLSSFLEKKFQKMKFEKVGVSTRGTLATEQAVQAFARTSVEQISSLSTEYVDEVANRVQQAVMLGQVSTLEKSLREYGGQVANKAEFYARDLVGDTVSEISAKRQQAAGFPGYVWMTSMDSRVRDSHAELHGRYFDWKDKPPGLSKPGATKPGMDYNCRCTPYPALGPQDQLSEEQRAQDIAEIQAPTQASLTEDTKTFNSNHQSWSKQLRAYPESELQVYEDYKLNTHREINGALRAGDENEQSRQFDSFFSKASIAAKRPFVAYRAVPNSVAESLRVGGVYQDAGYSSTSMQAGIADLFVRPGYGQVLKIKIPKGTRHVYGMREEMEVILAKNGKLKIIGVADDGIEAEYIPG